MAYTLNGTNFTVYGVYPGKIPGSNVAAKGMFNLPERIGKTFHSWGELDGIEPYVDATEIFFGGRDIIFTGNIFGSNAEIYGGLKTLSDDVAAVTGTRVFAIDFGNYNVVVKDMKTRLHKGAATVEFIMREPVVDLTGGSLPGTGSNANTIDSIPMSSFGLYTSEKAGMTDVPAYKEAKPTLDGAEGFFHTGRAAGTFSLEAVLIGSTLSDFQSKVRALYLLFSSSGERQVKLNDEVYITCFADKGFKISDLHYSASVVAKFKIELMITNYSLTGF